MAAHAAFSEAPLVQLMSLTAVNAANTVPVALATVILLFAALHDLAFRTIPNWVAAFIIVIGCTNRVLSGSFLGGIFTFCIIFFGASICWKRGWLGGGDVKLLAACGLLVPPLMALDLLLKIALAGGGLSIVYLLLHRFVAPPIKPTRPKAFFQRILRAERYRIGRGRHLPYASAIVVGTLLVLFRG